MNQTDQIKLLNAGFTIITGENHAKYGLRIKGKTKNQTEWHTLQNDFKSKAELKRRLTKWLEDPKVIDLYDSKNSQLLAEEKTKFDYHLDNYDSTGGLDY